MSTDADRERIAALRAAVRKFLTDRADYFERAPSYREWKDAARSYRVTADEVDRIFARCPECGETSPLPECGTCGLLPPRREPPDYTYNLAKALFEAANQNNLIAWSDDTRDFWTAKADAILASPNASRGGQLESLELIRHRDVQAIGAALSNRNLQAIEAAYNGLRDNIERLLTEMRK